MQGSQLVGRAQHEKGHLLGLGCVGYIEDTGLADNSSCGHDAMRADDDFVDAREQGKSCRILDQIRVDAEFGQL